MPTFTDMKYYQNKHVLLPIQGIYIFADQFLKSTNILIKLIVVPLEND